MRDSLRPGSSTPTSRLPYGRNLSTLFPLSDTDKLCEALGISDWRYLVLERVRDPTHLSSSDPVTHFIRNVPSSMIYDYSDDQVT